MSIIISMMEVIYLLILHVLYVNGDGANMAGYTSIGTTNENDDIHLTDNTVSFYPNEMFNSFNKHGGRVAKKNRGSSSHARISVADGFPGVAKIAKFNESYDVVTSDPSAAAYTAPIMPFSAPKMPFGSNELTSRTEGFFMNDNKPEALDYPPHNIYFQTDKRTPATRQLDPESTQLAGFTSMDNLNRAHNLRSHRRRTSSSHVGNLMRRRKQRRRHYKRRHMDHQSQGRRTNMFNLQPGYNGMSSNFHRIPSNNQMNNMAASNIPVNGMSSNFASSRMASGQNGNRMITNNFRTNRMENDYTANSMAIDFLANKLASSLHGGNNMASKLPVNGQEYDQYGYMKKKMKKSLLENHTMVKHGKHHIAKKS